MSTTNKTTPAPAKNKVKQDVDPLSDLKIVEIGSLVAAPYASRIFAEFGADVIKVEPDSGDPLRRWRIMHEDTSLWWYLQSRNKRSICLNLKSSEGVEAALELIAGADVLIENLKPGAMEKLGLGWERLSLINPNLVFVRISGFGQTGPMRNRPGFGAIGEAVGGIRYTTGSPEQPPSRVGVSLGDSLAGLQGVIGALIALHHVRNGGEGQVVDVSLFESVFSIMESLVPEYAAQGVVRERTGGKLPGISPSNTYQAKDDAWIVIAGNSEAIFQRLMCAIGRDDIASDPEMNSNDKRVKNDTFLDGVIATWVKANNGPAVIDILERADVPCSTIYSVVDMMTDAHFEAREMILSETLHDGSPIKMPGIVPKLTKTPGRVRWLGPKLGEHTREILSELASVKPGTGG